MFIISLTFITIIYNSLLTLSRVITALGQPQQTANNSIRHIGYRDSKLTRVLQPSLSGNAKLAFVCCISVSGLYIEETKSTLLFAQRIKHVKTASRINLTSDDKIEIVKRELRDTKQSLTESFIKIQQLQLENNDLKSRIRSLQEGDRDRSKFQIKKLDDRRKLSNNNNQKNKNSTVNGENNKKPRRNNSGLDNKMTKSSHTSLVSLSDISSSSLISDSESLSSDMSIQN